MIRAFEGPKLPPRASILTPATDLAYFRQAVLDNERGPSRAQFEQFTTLITQRHLPKTVDELSLTASAALAVFDNAHSTLTEPKMRRLPIRLHWVADGLVVVKATSAAAALLGHQIVSIGGRSPDELLKGAERFIGGGTPGWRRYRSEYFLTAPVALRALGATVADDQVIIESIDEQGTRRGGVENLSWLFYLGFLSRRTGPRGRGDLCGRYRKGR